jgi:hypothetical protein
VAAQGEGVLVLAGDPVARGDVLPGLAHRLGRDAEPRHPRVDHPPAERGVVHRLRAAGEAPLGLLDHPGRSAHRLDAACQVEVALSGLDRPGGAVDRLQAGGAEAVDGGAGDALRQPGEQRRHPGDVAVVLARLIGGAEVNINNSFWVHIAALDHGTDHVRGEVVGADAGEGAAVGAHRGADGLDYVGLGHGDEPYPSGMLYLLGTIGMVVFMVAVLLVVGHFYPGSSATLVDWFPTRSPEVEAQNEIDDVRQMMEAQNEMRRRRGAPEMTEEDLQRKVAEDERLRLRGRGPFDPS